MGLNSKYFIIYGIIFLVFYIEFFSYWILPLNWLEQPNCSPTDCKKLLLVADPQIIGPEWKEFFLLDWIAIFDSDRYIRKTFAKAFNYVKPDIIIYLGDLMDQGHRASDIEFVSYVYRINSVFDLLNLRKKTKVILFPGDNDIGGIDDVLIPANVVRFNKIFNQSKESISVDFIEFCKVDLVTSELQHSKFINKDIIRIALSHVPLIPKQSYILKEVVKTIHPHLIFSGHSHKSIHYATYENDIWINKHSDISPLDNQMKIYKFHEGLIHEILVPTCSYRMGVPNMGYGAAYIDRKKKEIRYNVLWLHGRFHHLFIYGAVGVLLVIIALTRVLRCRKNYQQWHCRNFNKFYTSML